MRTTVALILPCAWLKQLVLGLVLVAALPAQGASETEGGVSTPQAVTDTAAPIEAQSDPVDANRITREGVVIEFSARPSYGGAPKPIAADWADVSFRITDANTGDPIKGRYPAAWMDLAKTWEARGESPMSCRDRVSTYLKGIIGVRPMIDLNSHFVLVLNRDASISVIDPAVGITGITNLFAQVRLDKPGVDWAKTRDQKRVFVTMPRAKAVAIVDTETFKVTENLAAGSEPTRVVLQGDERYLWVGNDAETQETSGVTVIDTASLEKVAFIATGKGHHEITFSVDDRYAFVSNREDGTVSVIDVQRLEKLKDIATGPVPISLAVSPLGKTLYVADASEGVVTVVDGESHEIRARLKAQPGLGPLRFSPDGRWGFVVNPTESAVYVIDASTNTLAHQVPVSGSPYQVRFTRNYAYVRSLGTENVGIISLVGLDAPEQPAVKYFPAGEKPPGQARDLGIAASIVPSVKEAAVYVVNPAEGTVFYYMEGMTAPMGGFRNYGNEARAVEIVDRSLSENQPGVYTGRVKIPLEGTYDIAFIMDTPRFLHCFSLEVEPNPAIQQASGPMGIKYLISNRMVPVGETVALKFKLSDPVTGQPKADLKDVRVLYYTAAGGGRTEIPAEALGDGLYEAKVTVKEPLAYYAFVASASEKVGYNDLPFATLIGVKAASSVAPPSGDKSESAPGP